MIDIAELFEPKPNPEHVMMATHILGKAKRLVPDRVPQPNEATVMEWAETLASAFRKFDPQIWPKAVTIWSAELADKRMVAPRDIIHAATLAHQRWMELPESRAMLEQRRQQRADWLAGDQ